MMKKIKAILICLLVISLLGFAGCKEEVADTKNQEIQEVNHVSEESDPKIEAGGKIDSQLETFEKNLKGAGMKVGEKAVKDASALGAMEGYGFNINDIPVEVYLFDKSSSEEWAAENLKSAAESQSVTIFGVEINGQSPTLECVLNDALVVIFPMESMMPHPDKDKIVEIFKQL